MLRLQEIIPVTQYFSFHRKIRPMKQKMLRLEIVKMTGRCYNMRRFTMIRKEEWQYAGT